MIKRRRFLTALGLGTGALAAGGYVTWRATSAGPGWRGPKSDHFDGRHFFNVRGPTGNTFSNVLKWQSSKTPGAWPARVENTARPTLPGRVGDGEAYVTLVNHCTFLIQLPGCSLLTDPVWSPRVSPFGFMGPLRVRDPGVAWADLPKIDAVLVSHNHFDHLDLPTLKALQERFQPAFITGLGNGAFLKAHGFTRVEELDWWQAAATQVGNARLTFTPAQHWSSRSLLVRNTTLWGGFWIETGQRKLYFAGDSAYCPDFADIRQRLGAPDLAMLPIGAYEPRWFMKGSHLGPDEALLAHRDLGAKRSLGMHFDTFQLGDEGFGDAERELAAALTTSSLKPGEFHAPATGETVVVA